MTDLLTRPVPAADAPAAPPRRRRAGLVWLLPTLLVAAVVNLVNLAGAPQRIDDEGTYTAQAWAVGHLGELTHYTYWYDHPPLGWLQVAAWSGLTGGFERYDVAVVAAREAMVVAALVSTALVWLLGRRLGLSRPGATAAAAVFALSPLALQFHRQVYLDNVATPWLLVALVLATVRRSQLLAFTAAAAAFGVAVLSKETYLLALPLLAWTMWRSAAPATRRYTLTVAATVLAVIGVSYVALALVKGELVPGTDRVSLVDGLMFQLGGREASGSPFDAGSLTRRTLDQWWQLDPVLVVATLVATLGGLAVRRLRAVAVLLAALLLVVVRPGGYLPVPYVVMLLPLAALLVAGVPDAAVRAWRRSGPPARAGQAAVVALAVAGVAAAGPLWAGQLRGFLRADLDAPMRQAQTWLETNVARDDTLVVDDAMWVDLVEAGFERDDVLWYYKVDTDPAVTAGLPDGWRDLDWVVTTDSMRTFPTSFPRVADAIANSTVVATFGTGTAQVDVRRVDPAGAARARADLDAAQAARAAAGAQLAANPRLSLPAGEAEALRAGQVDDRILLALGDRLATGPVAVAGFPALPGETGPRRQVLVTAGAGDDDGTGAWLTGLSGLVAPQSVRATPDGTLVTFGSRAPAGLLPAP